MTTVHTTYFCGQIKKNLYHLLFFFIRLQLITKFNATDV